MRKIHRWQRILFLSFLCFTVVAPIVIVSSRLKYLSFTGRRDFIEDQLSTAVKDSEMLNAIEQEADDDLHEPTLVVLDEKDFDSSVNLSNRDGHTEEMSHDSLHLGTAGEAATTLGNDGGGNDRKEELLRLEVEKLSLESGLKEKDSQTRVQQNQITKNPKQRAPDEKIKEIRDQLIRAKAYLTFAPPDSTAHMVKELKLRIKELERAVGDRRRDSQLSKNALQKLKAMEGTLAKASRVFPDCAAMAKKLRAMNYNAQEQVRAQKNQSTRLLQLVSRTTPKGLHCITMRLTAEYFALTPQERELPNQEKVRDPTLYHYAVFSDNVLACAVVVNSTVSSAKVASKIVFHVVTDSLNLPAISMWFFLSPPGDATIQIQSIDDFEGLSVKYSSRLGKPNAIDPRYTSALNHLRFYLPDVFPMLNKLVLFDHDVVVQQDLSELWSINMDGKVNAAVHTCQENETSFQQMDLFINFSDPLITDKFDPRACTWAFGMNLFDLQEWRRRGLTAIYQNYWQSDYARPFLKAGSLPIGWLTFYDQTIPINKRWQRLSLGYDSAIATDDIEQAAVLHYDGVKKPWLDIAVGKYKIYWNKYINYDHPYLQQCNIHE